MSIRSLTQRVALRPVALGISVLALTGGHAAYEATAKTITVSVDGHAQKVRLHGSTVAQVLKAAHLAAGLHDLLSPDLGMTVNNGSTIVLRRGRPMQLTVDGAQRTVWVTATSVEEALGQIGLRAQGALLSADRSRGIPLKGFSLDVRTLKTVQILDAGKARRVTTNTLAVNDLLAEAKVVVRKQDSLSVPTTAAVTNGLVLRITRVDGGAESVEVPVPFAVRREPNASMYQGQTKVVQEGRVGVIHQTYALKFVNHQLAKRVLAGQKTTAQAVPQIIAYGTKARPHSVAGADGLNWGALARCESGGNPRAVSSNGSYRGLYQFTLGTWQGVGGSGDPIDASSSEQIYRAKVLYKRSGRSPWPVCGRYL